MDELDRMLTRMATVAVPQSLGDDPAFVARLDSSATRGALLGTARSVAIGMAMAALMVAIHPSRAVGGGSLLLTAASGEVL